MPRQALSGTKYLLKRVRPGVPLVLTPWSGRYKGYEVVLAKWANCEIDTRTNTEASKVVRRFVAAVDNGTFDPAGEQLAQQGTMETLATFITEWKSRYAEEYGLTANSLDAMLDVIAKGRLGGLPLKKIGGASDEIEQWLNVTGKRRHWKATTWNDYHNLLNRVLKAATRWKLDGKPRLTVNPMSAIERRVKIEPEHFKQRHLEEDVEDRLFAACEQFGTRGVEMRRRLIAGFDGGLRAGEMLRVQLNHVNWKPLRLDNGEMAYVITLPPSITKGGKTSGRPEKVYVATARFRQVLESRRFQLKSNPDEKTFIFGFEDGRQQKGFRRMWRQLFTRAGLKWGRHNGLVWHTIRHEFISRLAENTKDPVLTQEMARHKDLETTQGYFHSRRDRLIAAAVGLERRR